jgi:hypothetical protein
MNTFRPSQNHTVLSWSMGVACLLLISLTASLFSQGESGSPDDLQNQPQNVTQTLSPESLQQLLAPIALYPDALIALILPASTVPSDVVLASRYLAANGDPQNIPNQSWDSSVQSLASYPEVITWMDQNLQWTTTLGEAFLAQQADVMSAIQQLRSQAQLAGNLVDTPQQRIVKSDTVIRIVPAEADYLYVPQYDPAVVYVQPYSQEIGPLLTFGVGFAVGAWLNYDCDWNHHQIDRGDWQPGWNNGRYQNGGNQGGNNAVNVVNINQSTAQPWQPTHQNKQQQVRQKQNFARINSNLPATARAASAVTTGSALTHAGQINTQIPRPSRANFVNGRGAKSNEGASLGRPAPAMPQTAQVNRNGLQPSTQIPPAPVVGQNGENQLTAPQHTPVAKPHDNPVVSQTSSVAKSFQPPAALTHLKSLPSEPATASALVPKLKSQESSPANNPRPQQVSEEPKHHTVVSPPEAPRQQQRPEPPPSVVQPPVHTSAPPAQISKAPAANPDQTPPSGKNPDKKKKDEPQLQ